MKTPRKPLLDFCKVTDEESVKHFRFLKNDIIRLAENFQLPEFVICNNGTKAERLEAMCIVLKRLAYPCRWTDLLSTFGRTEPELSLIFNETVRHIYTNFSHLLEDLNQPWLEVDNMNKFAEAVHAKGAALTGCIGFIDGTLRPCSRPSEHQEMIYSGHKRCHGLKFQGVMAPNGLFMTLHGPFEGKRHDITVLSRSGLLPELEQHLAGHNMGLYGDAAYQLHPNLTCPFKGNLTQLQEQFNESMSSMRQCVEWGFCKVLQQFSFVDFKKNLKLHLQPIGMYYTIATLLTNCHTCLYRSQTSDYFGVAPPTLENYLNRQ